MTLDWLEFDYSEDAEGNGSFDSMAAASPAQLAALEAEIVSVLAWAHAHFGDPLPPDRRRDTVPPLPHPTTARRQSVRAAPTAAHGDRMTAQAVGRSR